MRLSPLVWCLLLSALGCRALPWRCPSDEGVVAAREQGRLGTDSLLKGRLQEAEVRFLHALERCPGDFNIRHDLARVYWQQGKHDEALASLNAALAQSGVRPEWLVEKGEMLLEQHRLPEARAVAEDAVGRAPHLAEAWRLRGDVLKASGDWHSAIRDYHRAISELEDPRVLVELADIYQAQGRPRRCLAMLHRHRETSAELASPEVAWLMGQAYASLERYEDAIPALRQAASGLTDNATVLVQLAEAHYHTGDLGEAQKFAALAAQMSPQDEKIAGLVASLQRDEQVVRR